MAIHTRKIRKKYRSLLCVDCVVSFECKADERERREVCFLYSDFKANQYRCFADSKRSFVCGYCRTYPCRYDIDLLIQVLEDFLGFTNMHKAYLFGVGSLGGALLRDSGLSHFGLQIVGAFDVNPDLVGTKINGIPIYHSDDFEKRMKLDGVNIGVLTVPIAIAQEISDKMIAGGIKAIWNFTPFRIRVPENIVVQNTSLYAHLAVMFNRLNETIRNNFHEIIAIGMNYPLHCKELHADEPLPQEPVIFMKPDSALLKDSKPFYS